MIDTLEMKTVVAADGQRLHLEGEGAPIALMLHGLGYASWEARVLREHLPRGFGLWSLDNRGTGLSDPFAGPTSIDQLASDAAASIRVLGAPVIAVGHSMGGYIAMTLAVDHPELVRGLILIGTSPGGPAAVPVPASTVAAWVDASSASPEQYARRTMPLSFRTGWADENPARFEELLATRLSHPTSSATWRAQFEAAERFLADGLDLGGVRMPAMVVHGTDDRVVPVDNGRLLATRIAGADFREVDRGGHLIHLEEPDHISGLIVEFASQTLT